MYLSATHPSTHPYLNFFNHSPHPHLLMFYALSNLITMRQHLHLVAHSTIWLSPLRCTINPLTHSLIHPPKATHPEPPTHPKPSTQKPPTHPKPSILEAFTVSHQRHFPPQPSTDSPQSLTAPSILIFLSMTGLLPAMASQCLSMWEGPQCPWWGGWLDGWVDGLNEMGGCSEFEIERLLKLRVGG